MFSPFRRFVRSLSTLRSARTLTGRRRTRMQQPEALEDRLLLMTQNLLAVPSTTQVQAGDSFSVAANYSTTDPAQTPASGMTLRLHFDSTKVDFNTVTNVVNAAIRIPADPANVVVETDPIANGGFDNEAATDSYVQIVWGTLDASFPDGIAANQTVTLYDAMFTAKNDFAGTALFNFSSPEPGNGFAFAQQGASVSDPVLTQVVEAQPTAPVVAQNGSATVNVLYSTENAAQTPASGMTLRLHFDSSKVAFTTATNVVDSAIRIPADPAAIVVEDDPVANGGGDNDPDTDKFIQVVWGTLDASFPMGITTNATVSLFQAMFDVAPTAMTGDMADFNVSSPEPGNGFAFRGVGSSVTIAGANTNPVAQNDDITVRLSSNGATQPTTSGNVLADNGNGADSDADGDTLTVNETLVTAPTEGAVVLMQNGDFTYTPVQNASGPGDTFSYQLLDGNGGMATGVVSVTFQANQEPVAANDVFMASAGNTLTGDLLADNGSGPDTDADNDTLTVNTTPVTAPTQGTLVLNASGTFTYMPSAGATGTDTFRYQIMDGFGGVSEADVTINLDTQFDFDIDGDGNLNPLTDAILMFAVMDPASQGDILLSLLSRFSAPGATRGPQEIIDYITGAGLATFDMDLNGNVNPLQDGIIIFGLLDPASSGATLLDLIDRFSAPNPGRTPEEIVSYFESLQGISLTQDTGGLDGLFDDQTDDDLFDLGNEDDSDLFGDGDTDSLAGFVGPVASTASLFSADEQDELWLDLMSL